ncbi:Rod shape-determining protein MreB [Paenibacillus konkukensis]|uniref:Cell shape-determining protein MreB n=1 Tax=Paenibacillus konkukensis TaxID=2020716 RepID=A0ABY4RIV8_9BACL|nr:rod shape-determining protein [Paenibacillus konkukensis]UQZ81478.1 Rod shape-determining protein MreB [Paenibacillus konkukensis]
MFNAWELQFGIDLGTSNTIIYQHGKGIVLQEPSVIAVRQDTGEIQAFGAEAQAMIGRAPGSLEIIYPLQEGVISNYNWSTAMLQHFMRKIHGRAPWFRRSKVFISIPCGITSVQKRAVEETVLHKGSNKAITIEEPLAAALGAGLPVDEPMGNMILNIGGGTSQVAILSLGGIVASRTTRRGGLSIDKDIIEYVKKEYNLEIGERTAEDIKIRLGTVIKPEPGIRMDVRGRDMVEGLPKTVTVTSEEIYKLLDGFIVTMVETIRSTLEDCPPELAGDVMEQGIILCGGGSLLKGLDIRLQEETQIPIHLADQPQECTALGAGKMLEYDVKTGKRSASSPAWTAPKSDAYSAQEESV